MTASLEPGMVRRALSELATLPETSTCLRRYLTESIDRDAADVINEIETLAHRLSLPLERSEER